MLSVVDNLIGTLRPVQLKGKGFVFDFVTPRAGLRRVRVWGDYEMTLDLSNIIHRQIFMGCFGRFMTECTRALLPNGGTFLDVGAHAGYFTLLAAHRVGPGGRVFALEPTPQTFKALQRHLSLNGINCVSAQMLALSDADGALRLYMPPASEHRDYNVTCVARADWTAMDVPCRRLDECLSEWGVERIDLMKMDVEGAEPRVLAGGARRLCAGAVRHLIVEVNGPRLTEGGSSPLKLFAQLAELGFTPARLTGGRARAVNAKNWDFDPAHEYDRLFIHDSAR
jgi:FkbM family methyltransferase